MGIENSCETTIFYGEQVLVFTEIVIGLYFTLLFFCEQKYCQYSTMMFFFPFPKYHFVWNLNKPMGGDQS